MLIEREKKFFFSISEQHEISLVHCAMVGSQKSRSCLGAELVSQLSKFLKNRGSTRNSNHSTKSFVFSSQNISEHLTTSWYISFVLFRFFFNLFEVERQIGVLKSIIASKFYEIRWSLDFFSDIYSHTLSLLFVLGILQKKRTKQGISRENWKKTSRVLSCKGLKLIAYLL